MKIKILQWNIGGGYIREKGADAVEESSYCINNIDYIANIISKHCPDIIFLQETHADKNISQAKLIADNLGYKYFMNDVYDHSHVEDGQELGQSIISKFPLSECQFDFFENPKLEVIRPNGEKWISHNKGISKCYADLGNGKGLCLKTLHSFPFRKFGVDPMREMRHIVENIENKIFETGEVPIILAGDFNLDAENLGEFFPRIFSDGFSEFVLKNPTTPKGRKYDHLIYKNIKHLESKIFNDVLTDHYPVVSEFEF